MEKENSERKLIPTLSRGDILTLISFVVQLFYFNLNIQAISVFAYRIVNVESNLIPYISVSYSIILFLFFLNFGRVYLGLNKKSEDEKMELFNSTLTSLFFIFFLNILAELLTSRVKF